MCGFERKGGEKGLTHAHVSVCLRFPFHILLPLSKVTDVHGGKKSEEKNSPDSNDYC